MCNVVDDYEQGVTTVIRGEDHLSNTPRQIHIQNALGYPKLEYAHLPLVLGNDKKRLSKRHAATGLDEYQSKGYLNSAILNCLARLGWSKGDKEIFYLQDLINDFELTDIQKAGAIFDLTKLDYLNSQHMAALPLNEFIDYIEPFLKDLDIDLLSHKSHEKLIDSMRSSGINFEDIAKNLVPYYHDISKYNEKPLNKFVIPNKELIDKIYTKLDAHNDWTESSLDLQLKELQEELGLSIPQINQPIRIALTGDTRSPSLGLTLELFGKDESLKRIKKLVLYTNSS